MRFSLSLFIEYGLLDFCPSGATDLSHGIEPGVPLQEYGVRNDCPCGSTIGPLVSKIGLRTVDIGCPMLSMHSIRETAGSGDVGTLIQLFETFFESFAEVDDLSNN